MAKVIEILFCLVAITGTLFVFFALFSIMARALAMHNLFFTLIREGEGKAFLHNKAFEKAVIRYKGFRLDGRWNVMRSDRREKLTKAEAEDRGYHWDGKKRRKEDRWWHRFCGKFMGGGLVFVGIWPFDTVYVYKFRWEASKEGIDRARRNK